MSAVQKGVTRESLVSWDRTTVVISVATSAAFQLKAFPRMRQKSKQTLQGCGGVLYL